MSRSDALSIDSGGVGVVVRGVRRIDRVRVPSDRLGRSDGPPDRDRVVGRPAAAGGLTTRSDRYHPMPSPSRRMTSRRQSRRVPRILQSLGSLCRGTRTRCRGRRPHRGAALAWRPDRGRQIWRVGLAATHHSVGLLWPGLAAGPRCYAPPLRFTRPGTHRPRGGGRLEPLHAPQSTDFKGA